MKKNFIVLAVLGALCTHGVYAITEWKPAEEPKTLKEVELFQKDAISRVKEAEKRKKEAEAAGNKEKIREEELNANRARYDLNTGRIAEARLSREFYKKTGDTAKVKQEIKALADALLDRKAIETRVKTLSDELQTGFQASTKIPDKAKELTDYYESVQQELNKGGEPVDLLQEQFNQAKEKYTEYAEQKEVLNQLYSLAREQKKGANTQEFEKSLKDRIQAINSFLSKKPETLSGNSFADRLKLDQKIPEDQINAVREDVIAKLSDQTLSDAQLKNELKQAEAALSFYKLDAKEPAFASFVKDIADSKPFESEQLPEGIVQKDIQSGGAVDKVVKGELKDLPTVEEMDKMTPEEQESVYETLASWVSWTSGIAQKGMNKWMETGAKMLTENVAPTLDKVAYLMEEVPEFIQTGGQVVLDAQESGLASKATGVMRVVPDKGVRDAAVAIDKVVAMTEYAKENPVTPLAKSFAQKTGKILKNASDASRFLAEKMTAETPLGEKIMTENQIKKVDMLVKQAKVDLKRKKVTDISDKAPGFFEKVKKSLDRFVSKVTDFLKTGVTGLKAKELNYQTARSEYLTSLGFKLGDKPTQKEILAALKKSGAVRVRDKRFIEASENFAKAANELANAYTDVAKKYDAAAANIGYLTKAWDGYQFNEKADTVQLVKTFFDMRDLQLEYLKTLNDAVKKMRSDIDSIGAIKGQPIEDVAQNYTDAMSRMITNEMVNKVDEYNKASQQLEDQVIKMKKEFQQDKAGQTPPGGGLPG